MSSTLLEKAILGKIPIYFVLAHGKDYSPSTQTVTSVPRNKLLILPIDIGQMLTYEAAEELAKRLGTREKLKQLLSKLPKGFTVLKHTDQFADTILKFHDETLWTGIYRLPERKLTGGLNKMLHKSTNVDMKNANSVHITPARKKVSTFLNENPEEEAVYIIASCRGVKNVPSSMIFPTRTVEAKRTSAQTKKLIETKRDITRKSKKRPTSSSNSENTKKRKIEPSKKRKHSPEKIQRKKQKMSTPSPVRDITRKVGALII
jgi:hypothetical protein